MGPSERTADALRRNERRRQRARARCPLVLIAVSLSLVACDAADDSSGAPVTEPFTTTVPPVTVPATESDLDKALQQCSERADDATFTFQPSKQMTEGQPETVEAVASASGVQPPGSLAGGEPSVTLSVSLACVVEASLVGPDFEIQPEGWQARSFLETDKITWAWQVKPEINGSALPLSLRLRAFVDAPGGGERIPIGPDDTTVSISVDAEPKSLGDRWSEFWSDPFWGAVSGLVIVLGGFTGAFRFLKKRWPWNRQPPSTPTT